MTSFGTGTSVLYDFLHYTTHKNYIPLPETWLGHEEETPGHAEQFFPQVAWVQSHNQHECQSSRSWKRSQI